jgi:hypothetical protein
MRGPVGYQITPVTLLDLMVSRNLDLMGGGARWALRRPGAADTTPDIHQSDVKWLFDHELIGANSEPSKGCLTIYCPTAEGRRRSGGNQPSRLPLRRPK